MAKAYTKAAKLKAKRAAQSLPHLSDVPRASTHDAKKRGRARQQEIEATRTPNNLIARARRLGKDHTSDEVLTAMRDVHIGDEAGRAIHIATKGDERRKLNAILFQWRKSHARFLGNVIGRSLWSGKDSIPHVPERFETREDTDVDLRTTEEKADAARKGWELFCRDLEILTDAQLRLCYRGVWDVEPVGFTSTGTDGPRLTFEGQGFMTAMRAIMRHAER